MLGFVNENRHWTGVSYQFGAPSQLFQVDQVTSELVSIAELDAEKLCALASRKEPDSSQNAWSENVFYPGRPSFLSFPESVDFTQPIISEWTAGSIKCSSPPPPYILDSQQFAPEALRTPRLPPPSPSHDRRTELLINFRAKIPQGHLVTCYSDEEEEEADEDHGSGVVVVVDDDDDDDDDDD
ncbi:unnamed protein product, partial [Dibothriocephalus latus]